MSPTAKELTPLEILFAVCGLYLKDPSLVADPKNIPALEVKMHDHIMQPEVQGQDALTGCMLYLNKMGFYTAGQQCLKNRTEVNNKVVATLYQKMHHPPLNMTNVEWRTADGSTAAGKSSYPYARSVVRNRPELKGAPEPNEVFEKLLQRKLDGKEEKIVPSEDGLSSLVFAFGTLVIHSVFNTNNADPRGSAVGVNEASSYFDLSLLYGDNEEELAVMRNPALGLGKISVDCFSDNRVMLGPPAGAALLVLFNRNHNYIADEILKAHGAERGWVNPPPTDREQRRIQDEGIFQTARLINCITFINVVITDYVGSIMGVAQGGGGWPGNAEALDDMMVDNRPVGRGEGNNVSMEFNILYRWHATLSKEEAKWTENAVSAITGKKGDDVYNLGPNDYILLQRLAESKEDPVHRNFGGIKKDPKTNLFNDQDIARLLCDGIDYFAGAFRANGSPRILGFVDQLGIRKARQWGVCTLNEFREWMGMEKYKSFAEWNQQPEVAKAAEELYKNIDDLELYPGLHAEGHSADGSNLQYDPLRPQTMRVGLLYDAIALIRGDRFATIGRNVESLTKWGMDEIKIDYSSGAYGGIMHKLLMRHFPNQFPDKNVYTWFPMVQPQAMQKALAARHEDKNWKYDRPVPKAPAPVSKQ